MEINIENKSIDLEIDLSKVYPTLEDLEIKPAGVVQHFKSEKYYGYNNVTVSEVKSETLHITPSKEEQQITGLFGVVNVDAIKAETLNVVPTDEEQTITGLFDVVNVKSGSNLSKYANSMTFKNLNVFETKDIKINLPNATDLSNFCVISDMFEENTNTTVETLIINCEKPILKASKIYFVSNSNYADNKLKKITFNVDFSKCLDFSYMLWNLRALEIIDGTPLDFTSAGGMTYSFYYLTALKEVRFAPNSIPKNFDISKSSNISDETVESIINGLGDLTGAPRFFEVGNQVGPSDFEYPEVEKELIGVTYYSEAYMYMTDGSPVYSVTYGESMINTYAYAKGGIAQTLRLPSNVKSRLTNEQKTRITSKNWNIA